MKLICLFCFFLLLCSCRSYQFVPNGFLVDGDEFYHNADKKISIELFGDFKNYSGTTKRGLRQDRLYSGDRKILKALGYGPNDVDVLFSGKPDVDPYYQVMAVAAKKGLLDSSAFIRQYLPSGTYFYRKTALRGQTVLEAIIPSAEGNYSLIYVASKEGFTQDFEHLLANNVRKPHRGALYFLPDRTTIGCDTREAVHVDLKIPEREVIRGRYTLTKVLKKERPGESLAIFTLNGEEVDPHVVFKLCPGKYRLIYSDLKHTIIWQDEFEVH